MAELENFSFYNKLWCIFSLVNPLEGSKHQYVFKAEMLKVA